MNKQLQEKVKQLNPMIGSQALVLAAMSADQAEVAGTLIGSRDDYIAKKALAIGEELEKAEVLEEKQYADGFSLLREKMDALPIEIQEEFKQNIQEIKQNILSLINTTSETLESTISKYLSSETLQEAFGFSAPFTEWMYQVGNSLFIDKKFKAAEGIFRILLRLNHLMPNYYIGFGLCKKEMGLYEEALFIFNTLTFIAPDNLFARYHSADLYLKLHQVEEALIELQELAILIEATKQEDWKPYYNTLHQLAVQSRT